MDLITKLEGMGIDINFTESKGCTRYFGFHPKTGKAISVVEVYDGFGASLDVYVNGDYFTDYAEALAALSTDGGPKLTEGQETMSAFGQGAEVRVGYNDDSTMYEVRKLWSNEVLFCTSSLDNLTDWLNGTHESYARLAS